MRKILMAIMMVTSMTMVPAAVQAKTYIDYGTMRCTAYCPCEECSGNWSTETYSGKTAKEGRTIAVDPDVIDIGSKVKIGDKYYIAEDTGPMVVDDTIDIYFDSHEEVEKFADGDGIKFVKCWVVKD